MSAPVGETVTQVRSSGAHYVEESLRIGASPEAIRKVLGDRLLQVIGDYIGGTIGRSEVDMALATFAVCIGVIDSMPKVTAAPDFSEPVSEEGWG